MADRRDACVEGAPDVGRIPQGGLGVRAKGGGPQGCRQRRLYTASSSSADPTAGELADTKKELARLKAEVKAAAKAAAKATANQTLPTTKGKGQGSDAEKKICFHFRDHGNCPKGDSCPYSHDKELRKHALAARQDAGHQHTLATSKGGGKAGSPTPRPRRKPRLRLLPEGRQL